jgi:hypothetical protein
MRVFVSSLIGGFEVERAAARSAITTLRHEAVMAEDFGAQPNSPQVACLRELRASDVVVLILGERYGPPQSSGLSATHEEYHEAKGTKPILAFVQEGINPEPAQQAFIQEVQEWEGGLFRQGFADVESLRMSITRALHDYDLTATHAPVDANVLRYSAVALLPTDSRSGLSGTRPIICISIATAPALQIIRPAAMEESTFGDRLQQAAQFGQARLFEPSMGTGRVIEGDRLVLRQESGASIQLSEAADIAIQLPLGPTARQRNMGALEGSIIFEDDVSTAIRMSLEFGSDLLEQVDPTQRLSHVAVAVKIINADYRVWRTRAEHETNPNSVQMGMSGSRDREPVLADFQRPALRLNRARLVEDITVQLRRQWRSH